MKALIAGGGIGGLTAALFLHRIGIEAEIFEQADEVRELGARCTDSGDRNVTEEASNPSRCGGRLRVDDIHRFTADPGAGTQGESAMQELEPAISGYAEAAEGLHLYYEIYGEGEPIVVLAGGLMPIRTMAQVTGPLSQRRQVIAIDLEGHGRTGLRDTPMSHERNGDDVAAVLRHLGIAQADVAGYSHGGDAAIWMAIQHPEMARNLIVIATAFARGGWYPEGQEGMSAVNGSLAEQMKATPIFEDYGHADQFPLFLDRMGELMRKDWNWREEVRALPMPVLLVFADHDSVSMQHIAEFFALFGGGIREPGWIDPQFSRARLAIIPGYTHYNLGQGPEVARVIEGFLTQPTSKATQFAP